MSGLGWGSRLGMMVFNHSAHTVKHFVAKRVQSVGEVGSSNGFFHSFKSDQACNLAFDVYEPRLQLFGKVSKKDVVGEEEVKNLFVLIQGRKRRFEGGNPNS